MYAQADSALENGNPEVMNELKEQFGENPYELKNILKYWVRSDKEGLRVIPTDSIVMKIDKEAVRRSGMKIPEALGDSIPEYMTILLRDANGSPKRALQERTDDARNACQCQLGTSYLHGHHRRQRKPSRHGQPLHAGRTGIPLHSVRYG